MGIRPGGYWALNPLGGVIPWSPLPLLGRKAPLEPSEGRARKKREHQSCQKEDNDENETSKDECFSGHSGSAM